MSDEKRTTLCIQHLHFSLGGKAWCGRDLGQGPRLASIEHAAYWFISRGPSEKEVCKDCLKAILGVLMAARERISERERSETGGAWDLEVWDLRAADRISKEICSANSRMRGEVQEKTLQMSYETLKNFKGE
jgi:hypothetical protein